MYHINHIPNISQIQKIVYKNQLFSTIFAVIGFFALAIAILTFFTLFIQMLITGFERLTPDFFMNFPSRRANQAGILSAWVGSLSIMIVTAALAVPLGVLSGIYLEEYAKKNILTDIIEINISNLA